MGGNGWKDGEETPAVGCTVGHFFHTQTLDKITCRLAKKKVLRLHTWKDTFPYLETLGATHMATNAHEIVSMYVRVIAVIQCCFSVFSSFFSCCGRRENFFITFLRRSHGRRQQASDWDEE